MLTLVVCFKRQTTSVFICVSFIFEYVDMASRGIEDSKMTKVNTMYRDPCFNRLPGAERKARFQNMDEVIERKG